MSVNNQPKTRRKYDAAFKEDVLKMVASGRPISELSEALGVAASQIHRWNRVAKSVISSASTSNTSATTQGNLLAENERLKAELRRTEQERDILKKACAIFSRTM